MVARLHAVELVQPVELEEEAVHLGSAVSGE